MICPPPSRTTAASSWPCATCEQPEPAATPVARRNRVMRDRYASLTCPGRNLRAASAPGRGGSRISMLSIKGLTHVYPNGTRALDGVDLEIGKGMFGLLGPNGAGK